MSNAGHLADGTAAKSNIDVRNRKVKDSRAPAGDTTQAANIPVESPPDSPEETVKILNAHSDIFEAMVAAFDVHEVEQLAMSLNTDLDVALGLEGTKK